MLWVEFSLSVQPELVEPIVELFKQCSKRSPIVEQKGGFNPDDGEGPDPAQWVRISTYVRHDKWAQRKKALIESGLLLLSMIVPFPQLESRIVDSDEWQERWKQFFSPMQIGSRFVVVPPWYANVAVNNKFNVVLDPGLAFGTGHHPTTRMCMEQMETVIKPGMTVLDLGVGSGILSIAAALLGANRVIGFDIEPVAIRSARQAIKANDVTGAVRLIKGTLPHQEAIEMDVVVANISAKVLIEQSGNLAGSLRPGGVLLASGVLEERAYDVMESFQFHGLTLDGSDSSEDWVVLRFKDGRSRDSLVSIAQDEIPLRLVEDGLCRPDIELGGLNG